MLDTTDDVNLAEPKVLGTLIRNGGGEQLLIPQADLDRIEATAEPPTCMHCDGPLEPRRHSGGRPKLFCSDKCRSAHHAGCAPPSNPAVNPPSNAPTLPMDLPTTEKPKPDDEGGRPFDWTRDADAVVLRGQAAIAVYINTADDLVIRQEREWDQEDDPTIIIRKEHAQAFLDAICDALGVRGAP